MTLAEVWRQYGITSRMAIRMIEFGYDCADGKTRKLKATRVRRRWDVSRVSLDEWAADYDAQVLLQVTDFIRDNGHIQLGLCATQEIRRCYDRLVAAGHLRHEAIKCQDSGIVWPTYFLPTKPLVQLSRR